MQVNVKEIRRVSIVWTIQRHRQHSTHRTTPKKTKKQKQHIHNTTQHKQVNKRVTMTPLPFLSTDSGEEYVLAVCPFIRVNELTLRSSQEQKHCIVNAKIAQHVLLDITRVL